MTEAERAPATNPDCKASAPDWRTPQRGRVHALEHPRLLWMPYRACTITRYVYIYIYILYRFPDGPAHARAMHNNVVFEFVR